MSRVILKMYVVYLKDPFYQDERPRGLGTKANPNIIDAMDDYRLIGCHCNPDDDLLNICGLTSVNPNAANVGTGSKSRIMALQTSST